MNTRTDQNNKNNQQNTEEIHIETHSNDATSEVQKASTRKALGRVHLSKKQRQK